MNGTGTSTRRPRWRPALVATAAVLLLVIPALARPKPAPTLSGLWRLDPSRSETPTGGSEHRSMGGGFGRGGGWGGMGGGHGGWGGGGRGGRGGDGSGEGRETGAREGGGSRGLRGIRPAPLPPVMRVTQGGNLLTLADTSGVTVAEIAIGDTATADSAVKVFDAPHFTGVWQGGHLVVTRELTQGVVVTDTWTLKSKGRELEIKSTFKPAGDRPGLEFKRVYARMES
ncbi:MAG: hypothetical protein ACHQ52_12085 [Candidatus Eisenbacteria bacterium]